MNLRYKQQKNLLLNEQQTEKEIRSNLNNMIMKHGLKKHEMR
jgi:hypothetical protein